MVFYERKILFYVAVCVSFQQTTFSAILRTGNPLLWTKAKPHLQSVRRSGVNQFIHHYLRTKDIQTPNFLWGDELEYGVFRKQSGKFDLSLRGSEIRQELEDTEVVFSNMKSGCAWQPEYGAWMVEAVPRDPYGGYVSDLLSVEKNMQLRRARLHSALLNDEIAPSLSNFPMLGVSNYGHTKNNAGPISNSRYLPDQIINPHPRFGALTQNIRMRRQRNVDINVPKLNSSEFIHMDAMAFGMGCCCLQVTMQASSDQESRFLHDQLAVLAPLFMALSASTPIFRGQLCDTDTRWAVISQAVDDRTDAECRPGAVPGRLDVDSTMVGGGVRPLSKSRYSSVSLFISQAEDASEKLALDSLNDINAEIDEESYSQLRSAGVDEGLARHIAHLFTRDPLVIFDDAINLDDRQALDHFENIQSTNWRSMRWKPPALDIGLKVEAASTDEERRRAVDSGPGWRIEFRPLEVQLTDFENAAYALLVVLTTRSILAAGFNFYMPMSLVEENMRRAEQRDAAVGQRFYVRRQALDGSGAGGGDSRRAPNPDQIDVVELTLDEFMNGQNCSTNVATAAQAGVTQGKPFPGLLPSIVRYLEALGCSPLLVGRLQPYLRLLQRRASGELPTTARWTREWLARHPLYQAALQQHCSSAVVDGTADSVTIPSAVADELLQLCEDIGMGRVTAPELVGDAFIAPVCVKDAWGPYLASQISTAVPTSLMQPQSVSEQVAAAAAPAVTATPRSDSISAAGQESLQGQLQSRQTQCCHVYEPVSTCSGSGSSVVSYCSSTVLGDGDDTYLGPILQ